MAKARCECGFLFITFLYPKAVKSGNDIKLSIELGLVKPFKGLIYKRYRVSILNRDGIKPFIIDTELETFSWLLNKKDGGSCGGYARANKPFVKVLVDILFYS